MAIARVQLKAADTGSVTTATSLVITLDAPTTAGNVVIIALAGAIVSNLKVTSTNSVFNQIYPTGFDGTTANEPVSIYLGYMFGADTVFTIAAINAGQLNATAAIAIEYSGARFIEDGIPSIANGSGVNSATTGALTNTDANALFVGAIGVKCQSATENTAWALSVTSPFTIASQITTSVNTSATSDRAVAFCEAIVSTAAARTANVTHGLGTLRYAGVLGTFHQLSSGGGLRLAGHGGLAS